MEVVVDATLSYHGGKRPIPRWDFNKIAAARSEGKKRDEFVQAVESKLVRCEGYFGYGHHPSNDWMDLNNTVVDVARELFSTVSGTDLGKNLRQAQRDALQSALPRTTSSC